MARAELGDGEARRLPPKVPFRAAAFGFLDSFERRRKMPSKTGCGFEKKKKKKLARIETLLPTRSQTFS
jgi:hypothetical protein